MADAVGEEKISAKSENTEQGGAAVEDSEELERFRLQLRQRWELASVLNFLHVFEPVMETGLKFSAEDIETGLIKPDKVLSDLHIKLLQGISPGSRTLDRPEGWVTVLCNKLAMWWPSVAEGNIPLTASKGKEISMYKELDPTSRLLLLKALCELRADQDDIVSYINDEIKSGTQISQFRKDNIGYDDKGITYWCDGSTVIGYRLYKEVTKFEKCRKGKGKGSSTIPRLFCYQWETLACNLEEFREVVDKFSSSENNVEVAVSESVKGDAISALEKIQKKKERALQKKKRQEMLLSGLPNLIRAGQTRSCRSRNPVSYTYENYDQAIKDAIQVIQKRKTSEDPVSQGSQGEHKRRPEVACRAGSDADINLGESSTARANGQENDTYMEEKIEGDLDHDDDDDSDDDYDEKADDTHAEIDLACSSKEHKRQKTGLTSKIPRCHQTIWDAVEHETSWKRKPRCRRNAKYGCQE